MDEFLRFTPLVQERVWGGRALETKLGRPLPPGGRPIGESWEIVDRPEAQSVVVGGTFAGQTLRQVLEKHSAEIMGPNWPAEKPFPILVKWLDCRERLSLQVHPPAVVAAKLGGEPKTENWFVAAAEPGAHLIVGLKPGVTREKFEAAVAAGTAEACVNRFPVAAGDSVLVRSGQVHAIDGGNLILEIQQNSDTTYRVDDWGRVGLDGKPRQLHVAESLQSILWDEAAPQVVKAADKFCMLAQAREFQILYTAHKTGAKLDFDAEEGPCILSIVKGRLTSAHGELKRGDNILVPYSASFVLTVAEDAQVLLTLGFCGRGPHDNEHIKEAENCPAEDLAATWIEQQSHDDGEDWAIRRVTQLCEPVSDPEEVWPIILRLVELSINDQRLSDVAAGPLEDLICNHGGQIISRVEIQAKMNPKFRRCLSGIWGWSSMPEAMQARIKKVVGDEKLQLPPTGS